MSKLNVIVIGCGRWGSFIGWYLDNIGHNVTIYGRETSQTYQSLKQKRAKTLPLLSLPVDN